MKKSLQIAGLLLFLGGASAQQTSTLQDKVKSFSEKGRIKSEYLNHQYLLRERGVLSLVRRYELDGKMLEEFYQVIPIQFKHPLGVSMPISDMPYWYYFEGKHYVDKEQDGLNGNEVEQKGGDL